MPKLKLDALREGMVVAVEVRNLDDMLLLPAGGTLTARQIDILRSWGVAEIQIQATDEAPSNTDPLLQLAPGVAETLAEETKARFRGFDPNNPVQQELFRLALRRRARQLLAA